ncbi:ABC transporter substrate-binding protein [Thermogladius sp. 4427co]|uniref:ABC transporter substrate-binding protein n=1 Tax=Thermogladius sp. 4427co TaxID=3450718 RepID=UPI003F7970F3
MSETPSQSNTLTVIYWGDIKSWNPDSQVDDALYGIAPNLFDRLVALDYNYNIIPDLAYNWTVNSNATVFTFYLVRNATWHDGVPFTCVDVKWTFEAIKKYHGIAYSNLMMDHMVSVNCLDNYTVQFVYDTPFPAFLSFVAWYGTFILPAHIFNSTQYKDWMDPNIPALQHPIGTGPFKFYQYVKGSYIVLVANDNYFLGRPKIDKLVYEIVPDPTSAEQTFLSGNGDVLANTPPVSDIRILNQTPGIVVKVLPTLSRYYIGFNMLEPLFQNSDFRLAIAMSIDRNELNQKAYSGYAFPATTAWLKGMSFWWDPNATYPPYDPVKAQQILDQLGYKVGPDGYRQFPNGTTINLRLVIFQGSTSEAIAQVLQNQLKRVGLKVTIEEYEIATWETKVVKQRDFDIALCDGFHGPDPHNMYMRYSSYAYINFANYSDPEFNELVLKAAQTADPYVRRELYFKAEEIFARDLVYIPLLDLPAFFIYRQGWHDMPWDLIGVVPIGSYYKAWYGPSTQTSNPTSITSTSTTTTSTQTTSTVSPVSATSTTTSNTTSSTVTTISQGALATNWVIVGVGIIAVVVVAVLVWLRLKK